MEKSKKSSSEIYFEWWLDELKSVGIVKSYEREPQTFELLKPKIVFYKQRKKTKEVFNNFSLMRNVTYTPDYKVVFDSRLLNKLFGVIDMNTSSLMDDKSVSSVYQETLFYTTNREEYVLYFDVKPPAAVTKFATNVASSREFPIKQRLMYDILGIYVNKVVPVGSKNSLFTKTFLPTRYMFTDGNRGPRKLKDYEKSAMTLKQYLELKNIKDYGV